MPSILPIADVTVIVAMHNRAGLILRALDSISAQTLRPAAIIVIDDASTDDGRAVVAAWTPPTGTTLTILSHDINRGAAVARNTGMTEATTAYIAFLDSDDFWLPDALARLLPPLESHPDAVLCCADADVVDEVGQRLRPGYLLPALTPGDTAPLPDQDGALLTLVDPQSPLLEASPIPTCSAVFRRSAALAAGLMPDLRAGEDWLFWLRLAQQGRILVRPEHVAVVVRHDQNLTSGYRGDLVAQEHLRALLGLRDGTLGIVIAEAHLPRLEAAFADKVWHWRYFLSRKGPRAYWQALRSPEGIVTGGWLRHLLVDPKSAVRALNAAFW
jgi:glycosyltransferase involved in cell wall biosynthesis